MPTILDALPARTFGVELEIGNEVPIANLAQAVRELSYRPVQATSSWAQTASNNYWHLKFDRTCGRIGLVDNLYVDHGWEIASFIAVGSHDLEHIGSVVERLAEITNCTTNQNCGFHIHCDVADFTPKEMGILLSRWIKIEPMLCQMVPFHRVDNRFCRLLSNKRISKNKKYKGEEVWERLKPTRYNPHENNQKKVTLNTVNYAAALQTEMDFKKIAPIPNHLKGRKTVEFRLPEGTLRKEAISSWVYFFVRFVEISKKSRMPTNLKPITNLKSFFKYFGMEKTEDLDLLHAKLFLIDRLYKYGNSDVKKQLCRGLF
jgi:hypothetical protein